MERKYHEFVALLKQELFGSIVNWLQQQLEVKIIITSSSVAQARNVIKFRGKQLSENDVKTNSTKNINNTMDR